MGTAKAGWRRRRCYKNHRRWCGGDDEWSIEWDNGVGGVLSLAKDGVNSGCRNVSKSAYRRETGDGAIWVTFRTQRALTRTVSFPCSDEAGVICWFLYLPQVSPFERNTFRMTCEETILIFLAHCFPPAASKPLSHVSILPISTSTQTPPLYFPRASHPTVSELATLQTSFSSRRIFHYLPSPSLPPTHSVSLPFPFSFPGMNFKTPCSYAKHCEEKTFGNWKVVFDGLWWIMMDYDGLWWIMMDCDGLWWIMMDYDGLWWIVMGFWKKWGRQ